MIFKRIRLLLILSVFIYFFVVGAKFFLTPYFMPKIYIENKIGEKIEIYGPQYEERLSGSVENVDMNVARYFTYPVGYISKDKEASQGFWRRYFSSKETIEWRISWFYNDVNRNNLSRNISRATFNVDEKGDYCQLKLILTTEGIEVIPLRKNYCFKKIHLPPKLG